MLHSNVVAEERARAREIVHAHGRTALAFCALLDDKTYWFSPGGSLISYALVGRIAVALGEPIGPREDARAAIAGFVGFCAQNDWRPAFYEVYDELLDDYRAAGIGSFAHRARSRDECAGIFAGGQSRQGIA